MSQVITFTDYTPAPRFDTVPWSEVRIEEATTFDGTWAQIDVIALSPLDPDPTNPEPRDFTTSNASDTLGLWYRVIFADSGGSTGEPSDPVQNLGSAAPYATQSELFRILKVRTPSEAQQIAAQRDLDTATIEINAEIDLATTSPPLTGSQLDLVNGVCLDRAADLWRHRESAAGILGITDETVSSTPGRYSFARYVARLSVLKDQWGIA